MRPSRIPLTTEPWTLPKDGCRRANSIDAMVLQLDSRFKRLVEHGPCNCLDSGLNRGDGDGVQLERVILHTAAMISSLDSGLMIATQKSRSAHLDVAGKLDRKEASGRPSTAPRTQTTSIYSFGPSHIMTGLTTASTLVVHEAAGSAAPAAVAMAAPFSFQQVVLPLQEPWAFPPNRSWCTPEQAFKRRRPVSDVDGPNTATLGCKKRRLRRNLITSRLSRPFSLPATHIISRESAAIGDKRFSKLSAILSARWRSNTAAAPVQMASHPSPSSLLRRVAMINRFRIRVRERAMRNGDGEVADMAANAALLQQSQGLGLLVGARLPTASWCQVAPTPLLRIPGQVPHPHPLSQAASQVRLPPHSPQAKAGVDQAASCGRNLSRSPRMKPVRSPELRSSRPPAIVAGLDEEEYLDDAEASFPTSEYESRYDSAEEPDDVYADFGIIFGGGNVDDFSDEEGDHYEDYMDDMDGIPWTVR